jgi:hypothetical protein|tara:strand:- start:573 stop:893 length:321 start_codon:yes stop_codon:yes gene_type:complete
MSILENARAHFESKGIRQIEISEWDTTIHCTPFTMNEKRKLLKVAKNDDLEFLVRALIMKAKDAQGEPLFDLSDKVALMNSVDPDVITRVVTEITSSDSVEDMEGN